MGIFSDRGPKVHGSSMARTLFIAIFLLGGLSLFSQTTIWYEDFNNSAGTQNGIAEGPAASGWANSPRSSRLTVQEQMLRARELYQERIWSTSSINIYGYSAVSFNMDISTSGTFELSDHIIGEYRIDGNGWVQFGSVSGAALNGLNLNYDPNLSLNGRTLQIRLKMVNDTAES